ncbi:hypothetical protein C8J57DRAFT_1289445 [Mycena rebaudengoi]|nr:hypothetical protein C8J57DRAFT_1289445 [Mycena rebaudengoi]
MITPPCGMTHHLSLWWFRRDPHRMLTSHMDAIGSRRNCGLCTLHECRIDEMSDPLPSARKAPAKPPLTLPFQPPPQLSRGVPSLRKIFSRYPGVNCLASIAQESLIPHWFQSGHMDRFSGKIEFEPRYVLDMTHVAKDDDDYIVCCIAFNTDATSLAALSGPDGVEFVEAERKVLKIDPEEEGSFMWYRCSPG